MWEHAWQQIWQQMVGSAIGRTVGVCACVQAKAIRSMGCAAEAVTVGHNPYCKASAMDHSIVLPTTRKGFCCEVWFTYACSTPSQCDQSFSHVNKSSMDPNHSNECEHV